MRVSCTVLREPAGEIPVGYSTLSNTGNKCRDDQGFGKVRENIEFQRIYPGHLEHPRPHIVFKPAGHDSPVPPRPQ